MMKKILLISAFLLCLLPVFSVSVSAAAPTASLGFSAGGIRAGETVTVTVKISGCSTASLGIIPSYDTGTFELVSGEWLVSGSMLADFSDGCAVIAYTSPTAFNGDVFRFVLKAKAAAKPAKYSVTCEIQAEGYDTVNPAAELAIACNQHSYGAWTQTKAATCTAKGTETRTCSACGAEETRDVAAKGHTWGSYTATKQPTCTAEGSETRTCSTCKATESRSIAATGHNWSAWTQSKAPTCEAAGTETRTCSRCKQSENRSVAALGHNFSTPTVTKQPTCTQTGEETGSCSRCGKKTTQSVPALGHSYGAWTVTKKADCEHGGEETSTCSRCKEKQTRATAALGHDFEEPKIVKEPTLSETGLMQGKCKRCGKTTDQVIPCRAVDTVTGIEVKTEKGAFPAGTEFSAKTVGEGSGDYDRIKAALSDLSAKFTVLDLAATQSGTSVQPAKPVTVTVPVPEGYSGNTALYLIGEDGAATKIPATLSEDGKTVICEVSSLGQLAVVDLFAGKTPQVTEPVTTEPVSTQTPEETDKPVDTGAAPADTAAAPADSDTEPAPEDKTETGSKTLVVLLIIAAVVIVAEAAVIVVLARKKK